ncbi:hypothetical protein [Acinetobacter sp. ESBL14]|uniref:hypothetical protein n=1 Tax=Acinetobacter sp. ESBL14 TaxID=3077329 RepID=UPI002FC80992
MRKLFLLAMLLGLAGCGDNNQSDTTQTNTQVSTSKKTQETVPKATNYRLAASPQTMGAVAPLAGWTVTSSSTVGASTLIEASRGSTVSAALITPNAKQVANVLKGGLAGIALSVAVDQLLGAIDWVMDPQNSQIKYKVANEGVIQTVYSINYKCKATTIEGCTIEYMQHRNLGNRIYDIKIMRDDENVTHFQVDYLQKLTRPSPTLVVEIFHLKKESKLEKSLPLETVAEQVISNADSGSLDAQVATNIAAQNILNDVEQAEPVVKNLENNADDKCHIQNAYMNGKASLVELRYNEMYLDKHNLYQIRNDVNFEKPGIGSWKGHIHWYLNVEQKGLKAVIFDAELQGCPRTAYAARWRDKAPPPQPGLHSPG